MELPLRVVYNNRAFDVLCDVEPDCAVDELVEALTSGIGVPAQVSVELAHADYGVFDSLRLVADTGLLAGDTVELVRAGSGPVSKGFGAASGSVVVEVSAGPSTGSAWSLVPGVYSVGRGSGAQLQLSDVDLLLRHIEVVVAPDGSVSVSAGGPTSVDDQPVVAANTPVRPGAKVKLGSSELVFHPVASARRAGQDRAGQLLYNRTPYFPPTVPKAVVGPLDVPPVRPDRQSPMWLTAALSSVMGVVMFLATKQPVTLLFALMMPLSMLGQNVSGNRNARRKFEKDFAAWSGRLDEVVAEAGVALETELAARFAASPSTADLMLRVESRAMTLWSRSPEVHDFLDLRLGCGPVKPFCKMRDDFQVRSSELSEQQAAVIRSLQERLDMFESAPVTVNMMEKPVLGVWGPAAVELVSGLLVQVAALHSPQDVVVVGALGYDVSLGWISWLPHTGSSASPLDGTHVVYGQDEARDLCARLGALCDARRSTVRQQGPGQLPHVVVLLSESAAFDPVVLGRFLDKVPGAGMSVLWVGSSAASLPRQCDVVVGGPAAGGMIQVLGVQDVVSVSPEGVDASAASAVARRIAPLRDAAASSATSSLPRVATLSSVLGQASVDRDTIVARWQSAHPGSLRAAIGVDADGVFTIDLVEHGPHGLVAGTSGAGKSELLQSLVVSLATAYPPNQLNFLFVDYKGGAAFGPCTALPHNVGMVTDLDEALALRALVSLRAELKRREHLLAGRARDITELARVAPADCPPRLVIVVDEFATLVKEIPDFVAGMVDVAQRGRSLGIHLLLATQRPSGAVSGNILANTNLRISLRVLDSADSSSVIGSSEAASIPAPLRGRAYVRSGPQELVCVQTAWANAPVEGQVARVPVRVRPLAAPAAKQNPDAQQLVGSSQLVRAVDAVVSAGVGLPPPRRPWLEPLADVVPLCALPTLSGPDPARRVPFGVVDDPANGAQFPGVVDFDEEGAVVLIGASGSGKTTALRSLAALLSACAPSDAQMFGIDGASRALEQIEALPNVASVAHVEDVERVTATLAHLSAEVGRRRDLMAKHHVGTFGELRELGIDVPRLFLFVDGFPGFVAAVDRLDAGEWLALFVRLVAAGRSVGVHTVITTDRRASLSSSLFAAIPRRIVLALPDVEEYVAVGIPIAAARAAAFQPGRAFFDSTVHIQLAVVSDDPVSSAQAAVLRSLAERAGAQRISKLAVLPDVLDPVGLGSSVRDGFVRVGVEDVSLAPVEIDVAAGDLMVLGPSLSGRSTLLRHIAHELSSAPTPRLVFGLSATGSLERSHGFAAVAGVDDVSELVDAVVEAADAFARRASVVVCVDDADVFVDGAAGAQLGRLVKHQGVRLVVATEAHVMSRAFSGWLAEVRRAKRAVLFRPDPDSDAQLVGVRIRPRPGLRFTVGRAVVCVDTSAVVAQLAGPRPDVASTELLPTLPVAVPLQGSLDGQGAAASTVVDARRPLPDPLSGLSEWKHA